MSSIYQFDCIPLRVIILENERMREGYHYCVVEEKETDDEGKGRKREREGKIRKERSTKSFAPQNFCRQPKKVNF